MTRVQTRIFPLIRTHGTKRVFGGIEFHYCAQGYIEEVGSLRLSV